MSDNLKADLMVMLMKTVIPGDRRSERAWQKRCEMIADQVIDRCMFEAVQAGHDSRAEIERLTFELEGVKLLVDRKDLEALKLLADDNSRLITDLERIVKDNEKIVAESVWLHTLMASLVEHVRKRDLDEVVRICEVAARRLNFDASADADASIH
jgi:hypothetical protein